MLGYNCVLNSIDSIYQNIVITTLRGLECVLLGFVYLVNIIVETTYTVLESKFSSTVYMNMNTL